MRTGEGRGKHLEGEVEMVVSLSECLSKLTVGLSPMLREKYCWALKS